MINRGRGIIRGGERGRPFMREGGPGHMGTGFRGGRQGSEERPSGGLRGGRTPGP
jgi:hypothetical protein